MFRTLTRGVQRAAAAAPRLSAPVAASAARSYSIYPAPSIPRAFPTPGLLPSTLSFDSFTAAVGNTSLIRLRGPSEATGCTILAKLEWENPGGSVKDRAAVWMVKEAEEKGILVPGGQQHTRGANQPSLGLEWLALARRSMSHSRDRVCLFLPPACSLLRCALRAWSDRRGNRGKHGNRAIRCGQRAGIQGQGGS